MNDEIYYLEATKEFDSEGLDEALWAKLIALLNGDSEKAKYEYIRTRAERLQALAKANKSRVVSSIKVESDSPGSTFDRDFMSLSEFSRIKNIAELKVIAMIRDGFYVGRKKGEEWFVSRLELSSSGVEKQGKQSKKDESQNPHEENPALISVKDFAEAKGLDELKVIQMIRDGFYSGRLIDGIWCIEQAELNEVGSQKLNQGFFEKLINGDFSLPVHYWVFCVLGNLVFRLILDGLSTVHNLSLGPVYILLVMSFAYNIPVIIGLWRAAVKYKGLPLWRVLAHILAVLGALIQLFVLATVLKSL